MLISIIVPAFNEAKLIVGSLRSIQQASDALTRRGWRTELIVCDNNSTDATAELARSEGAHVVFEPINQIARARNTGARAASGGWLIFVDADSHPSAALFEEVALEIEGRRTLGGGCTMKFDGKNLWLGIVAHGWNCLSRTMRWAAGSFVYCEARAFRQVGGFNEKLFVSEEVDLSQRLKKLARSEGRRFKILHRQPLVTSARKIHLYSVREYLWFLFRFVLRPRTTLRSRVPCQPWYDGRR